MAGKRKSDRAGRPKPCSPGAPTVARRETRRVFWALIAFGKTSEVAGTSVGISTAVATHWFRQSGGMPPSHLCPSASPVSARYLSFGEREQLALLRVQGVGVRACARLLGRAASTISRALRRNAAMRSGGLEYLTQDFIGAAQLLLDLALQGFHRASSAVVVLGRCPSWRSARCSQSRRVSGAQPILVAIHEIAAHRDAWSVV